jgi:hypothetical protein
VSARTAEAAIKQYWPEHTSCLGQHDPVEDDVEGIVCPCGTILGFPRVDEPAEADEFVGPQPDDAAMGAHGPVPDDWAAQAAEDKMAAEQQGAPKRNRALTVQSVSIVEAEDPITSALTVIDPTMPYTPAEIESQLIDLAARLERGVHFQRGWEEQNYRDKLAFELEYNRKLLESERTSADLRKADAIGQCEELFKAKAISDMMVRAVRETMHNLRSLQSGYQTISNSIKSSTQSYRQGP